MSSIHVEAGLHFLLNFTFSKKCKNVSKLNPTIGRRVIRVLNLHREKPGIDEKIINDHRQDGNVARWDPPTISGITHSK